MSGKAKITHVIFDVDGLLIDTECLYTKIMETIAGKFDKQFTWEIKCQQLGKKEQDAAKVLIDALDLPITVEEYLTQLHALEHELFPHADLMPGAKKVVEHLHSHRIPIAIATGSSKLSFSLKTTRHQELFSTFSHSVFNSEDPDVKHGKPAPDCFQVAASRFDPPPNPANTLVFEDACNGVRGALAANMHCVWVPDERADKSQFQNDTKLEIIKSLEDFRPEQYGLPPYK